MCFALALTALEDSPSSGWLTSTQERIMKKGRGGALDQEFNLVNDLVESLLLNVLHRLVAAQLMPSWPKVNFVSLLWEHQLVYTSGLDKDIDNYRKSECCSCECLYQRKNVVSLKI